MLNVYIVYELNVWSRNPTENFPLQNCLFGTVKLVRTAVKSKSIYNGQEIAFDGEGLQIYGKDFAKNVAIFGVDKTLSSHTDNQRNNFLLIGEVPTDGVNDSTDAAEKRFSIIFSKAKTKFCQILHYHSANSYLY